MPSRKAAPARARGRLRIGGELRDGIGVETVGDPFDGSAVGEVCVGGRDEIEAAIAAAASAFAVTRRMPAFERAAILERTAAAIRARGEELADLIARESGKPIRFARAEVARAVVTFTLGASECRTWRGEVLPIDLEARPDRSTEGRLALATRVPRGPVAAISPFNFPLNLIAHKLAPAIAVGASIVLKPPPQCPLTGFELAAILDEAGLPPGALNVVHCSPAVAQRMVEDERMAVLSFTGSDVVGWKLKALAGKKQVLLELGGNATCVVDEGVDLDSVLEPIVLGAWANAGQVCIRVQRILVHASLYERFLEVFVGRTKRLAVGDPLDPETVVGPLIEERHVDRVLAWIEEARAGGARILCGGARSGRGITPAVITGASPGMKVCREEVFGPVAVVEPFDDFRRAIESCNASRFGLQAGIFTRDLGRALEAYRDLQYGGVMINDVPTFRVDNFPYGGTKDSGFGREGVRYAMEEMSEPKVLVMRGA
ncbi:MAG: aldehyde dehydrogenase family protein [Planctomycetota bacterium]